MRVVASGHAGGQRHEASARGQRPPLTPGKGGPTFAEVLAATVRRGAMPQANLRTGR